MPPSNYEGLKQKLNESKFVEAKPYKRGTKVFLTFSPHTPKSKEPGFYVVYDCKKFCKAFYIGEAGDLRARLTTLFRCNSHKTPHPCHTGYKRAFGEMPTYNNFCKRFKVKFISTFGMLGRLELEEKLKDEKGTNKKQFYENYAK
jgi:hypothetical protein